MRTLLLFLSMAFFSAPVLAEEAVSCPYHSGVYVPHPSVAFWLKKYDYKMSIKEPAGGFDPQTFHSADIHIDAYDKKTHKKISSYIAPIYCGMGSSGCYFEDKIRFLDLNKDFSRYVYKEKSPEAPYAYVLTGTPEFTKTKKDDSRFQFYTPEKEIPSFHGATLWILESCNTNHSKPNTKEYGEK